VLFPVQIPVGGYADETQKEKDDSNDGKSRQVHLFLLKNAHK